MLVGELAHVGAVIPTLPLYASLDQPAKPKQRTFATQTLKTNIRFQGLGQQVTPRGFGQQQSASGRVFANAGGRYGMFGLGQYAFDPYKSRKYRYSGMGQQVTPRGFGQQMAASGRAFAYGGGGGGMFGLGAVVPMEPIMAPVSARPTDVQLSQYAFDPYKSRKYRYSGMGQQVTPRGFGQQQSASGRVAGKHGRNGGLFGLGLPPGAEGATVEEQNDLFGVDDSLF